MLVYQHILGNQYMYVYFRDLHIGDTSKMSWHDVQVQLIISITKFKIKNHKLFLHCF